MTRTGGTSVAMTAVSYGVECLTEYSLGITNYMIMFLGHLRIGGEMYTKILRYCALRQQFRHDHKPLVTGIFHVVLPTAGGKGQDGVLLAEGYAVKRQLVLFHHLLKEVCQLLACGVGRNVVKLNVCDQASCDPEDHILPIHGEVNVFYCV